jgi:hypothetical protein
VALGGGDGANEEPDEDDMEVGLGEAEADEKGDVGRAHVLGDVGVPVTQTGSSIEVTRNTEAAGYTRMQTSAWRERGR